MSATARQAPESTVPSTFLDYLGDSAAPSSSRSRTKSRAAIVKLREQIDASYAEADPQEPARRGARVAGHRLGRRRAARRAGDGARDARARNRRRRPPHRQRSRRWSSRAASRTGSRSCATRAPGGRDGRVRGALRRARRARRRDARRLPGAGRADRPRRRRARGGRARRRRPPLEGLPAARRRRCSSGPRPTSSTKSARPTRSGGRRRETFLSDFRDLKIGDLDRPRRQRHRRVRRPEEDRGRPRDAGVHGAPLRRRRQALRPGRAARSRPEIHRRLASRARQAGRDHLGEGEDARQEGRCATWRRSC